VFLSTGVLAGVVVLISLVVKSLCTHTRAVDVGPDGRRATGDGRRATVFSRGLPQLAGVVVLISLNIYTQGPVVAL
jgi:hypothetical protein